MNSWNTQRSLFILACKSPFLNILPCNRLLRRGWRISQIRQVQEEGVDEG